MVQKFAAISRSATWSRMSRKFLLLFPQGVSEWHVSEWHETKNVFELGGTTIDFNSRRLHGSNFHLSLKSTLLLSNGWIPTCHGTRQTTMAPKLFTWVRRRSGLQISFCTTGEAEWRSFPKYTLDAWYRGANIFHFSLVFCFSDVVRKQSGFELMLFQMAKFISCYLWVKRVCNHNCN